MPVFMVRHNVAGWAGDEAPVIFVTAGVESAVARGRGCRRRWHCRRRCGRYRRRLNGSPLDEIVIDLAPRLLGGAASEPRLVGQPLPGATDRSLLVRFAGEWLIGGVALQT